MSKKRYEIITLGCKVNQSESAIISAGLNAGGLGGIVHDTQDAGPEPSGDETVLCIINTCTVTEKASMQSRQAIRRAIRNHPHARIIVTGCYAQTQPEEIKKIKGVHDIIGNPEKSSLPERLLSDLIPEAPFPVMGAHRGIPAFDHRTRAFLKIQDGCNAHCTYCIVPKARGRSRSMPFSEVLNSLAQLERAGHREIVLSGIHLGAYGKDLSPATTLSELLCAIEAAPIAARIRLSSIEPGELSDEIISLSAQSEKICRHFHIPLQSGDDGILKKMGRPYSRSYFRERVLSIHERMPDAAIGVDTLIGFPGETDAAFEQTLELIRTLPVSYLHVFPFSPRGNTPAAKFEGRLPADIVKSRCQLMRALGASKKQDFFRRFMGDTATVLVEGKRDIATGLLKGTTSNYISVLMEGPDELRNSMVRVTLERGAKGGGVLGRIGE